MYRLAALVLTLCFGSASLAESMGLEFEKISGVPSVITRAHHIDNSTTVLVEVATTWDIAAGAVTYTAYAFDCAYGAFAQFHDDEEAVAVWPAGVPEAGWYLVDAGKWTEEVGMALCADANLVWLEQKS